MTFCTLSPPVLTMSSVDPAWTFEKVPCTYCCKVTHIAFMCDGIKCTPDYRDDLYDEDASVVCFICAMAHGRGFFPGMKQADLDAAAWFCPRCSAPTPSASLVESEPSPSASPSASPAASTADSAVHLNPSPPRARIPDDMTTFTAYELMGVM